MATGCATSTLRRAKAVKPDVNRGSVQKSIRHADNVSLVSHQQRHGLQPKHQFEEAMTRVRESFALLQQENMQWQDTIDMQQVISEHHTAGFEQAGLVLTARIETGIELIRELENARDAWLLFDEETPADDMPQLPNDLAIMHADVTNQLEALRSQLGTEKSLKALAGPSAYHEQISKLLATAKDRAAVGDQIDDWLDQALSVARMRLASDRYQLYALAALHQLRQQQTDGLAGLLSHDDLSVLTMLREQSSDAQQASTLHASLLQILDLPSTPE